MKFTVKKSGIFLIIATNGISALHILSMNQSNFYFFIYFLLFLPSFFLFSKIIPINGMIDESKNRKF
jgi:hypothetical protein